MTELVGKDRILALVNGRGGPATQWLRDHLDYPHQYCCLIWPFSCLEGRYPAWAREGFVVHRLMCEYRNGPPPTPKHHSAHSCGRGQEGCVNPWHVSWKTASENQKDRFEDAQPKQREKLTPEQVDEIRALAGRERVNDTAKRFGVTYTNVKLIQDGKTWKAPRRDQKKIFTADEIIAIRSRPTVLAADLAEEFGVAKSVIQHIRSRSTYRWVGEGTALSSTTDGSGA